jgi:hypothetical protein
LTDGDVLFPWVYYGDSYVAKVYSIQSGTLAWTFPAADIREIAVFSRWGDGNRDGIKIGGVYVMLEGSGEWTKLDAADFIYGVGNANSSPGALCAVLNRTDGGLLAERATGLKIEFPSGQDNNYTGYAEIAAYATSPRDYAWSGAAGNQLVSDAGNWNDSATGAAAGEAVAAEKRERPAGLAGLGVGVGQDVAQTVAERAVDAARDGASRAADADEKQRGRGGAHLKKSLKRRPNGKSGFSA